MGRMIILALSAVILLCNQALADIAIETLITETNTDYMVIINAGEQASDVTIYRYQFGIHDGSPLPKLETVAHFSQSPGFATMADEPSKVNGYINSIFTKINSKLKADAREDALVYFYASAATRALDQQQQQALINASRASVNENLKRGRYAPALDPNGQVRVISGQEEALFNWLTVNQLADNFKHEQLSNENTIGSLDMGKLSSEIAFLGNARPTLNTLNFEFNNSIYYPYTYSYERYGIDDAINTVTIEYKEKGGDFDKCFAPGSHYPADDSLIDYGQGDFDTCVTYLQGILYDNKRYHQCNNALGSCSRMGAYQPTSGNKTWYAVGDYYPVMQSLGLADSPATLKQIHDAGKSVCSKAVNVTDANTSHTLDCFNAAWVYALLQGFDITSDALITAVKEINKQSTDWSLGAAIYLLT